MSKKLTLENAREVAAEAAQWVRSPEGQQALQESLERARQMADRFQEAQRLPPSFWHKEWR